MAASEKAHLPIDTPRLSLGQKILYGAGDSTNSMSGTIIDLFLLYYFTDILGLKPLLAGMVLLFGQIWDAVNDPLVGYLSDRSNSRFGRRRLFMAVSAVPLGLSYVLIWRLPAGLPQESTFLLALTIYIIYDTFNTGFSVPYQALGMEISTDYDERTSLMAWRMLFSIVTGLAATVLPLMIVDTIPVDYPPAIRTALDQAISQGALPASLPEIIRDGISSTNGALTPDMMASIKSAARTGILPTDFISQVNRSVTEAKRIGFPLMGLVFGLSFILFPIFTILAFRENPAPVRRRVPFLRSLLRIMQHGLFRRMLAYYYLIWATIGIMTAYLLYYFKYVLQMQDAFEIIAGAMFAIAALALPLWVKVSARFDKRRANMIGILLFGGSLFALLLPANILKAAWFTLPFLDAPVSLIWLIVLLVGIGLSAAHVLPNAIIPEAVDKGRLDMGINSDGVYYGTLNFFFKAGRAFALLAASAILQFSGYIKVTSDGLIPEVQPDSAILAIRLTIGLAAPVMICASVLLLRNYRIDRKAHAEILKVLAERERDSSVE